MPRTGVEEPDSTLGEAVVAFAPRPPRPPLPLPLVRGDPRLLGESLGPNGCTKPGHVSMSRGDDRGVCEDTEQLTIHFVVPLTVD